MKHQIMKHQIMRHQIVKHQIVKHQIVKYQIVKHQIAPYGRFAYLIDIIYSAFFLFPAKNNLFQPFSKMADTPEGNISTPDFTAVVYLC